ncbi:hypothetical protein FBU30_010022 [Linnemannia zychae]|nr:hypothetical protein FBU30_010022 [Linnemannia zychae]
MATLTPDELATLYKRRGHFDSTRKSLLSDFQNSVVGQQFASQLTDILQKCIDDDPSLLQREKPEFHQLMVERITKSAEYKDVQQFVDSLLQPSQYLHKIEGTLMTIVKEQAPPEKETTDHDKGKDHKSGRKSKDLSADSSSKTESNHSSSRRGDNDKHTKSHTTVKKELSLELPPRPQIKQKDHKSSHDTVASDIKRESTMNSNLSDFHSRKLGAGNTSKDETGRKIVPKKRNRRDSVDSNSSLSSPPSSSEGESDAKSNGKAGNRAKKLAKKAPKDAKDSTESGSKSQEKKHSAFNGIDSVDSIGVISGMDSDTAMDVDTKPYDEGSHIKKEPSDQKQADRNEEPSAMAIDQKEDSAKNNSEPAAGSIHTKNDKTDSTSEANIKSPPTTSNSMLASRTSPASSSTPSSQTNSPASSSTHRRRESEAAERRQIDNHSQHGKRPGHQPLPLPPRPNIVPLPPKPTPLPLHRRTSHSRNSSSANAGGNGISSSTTGSTSSPNLPSIPSGSPTAPSSGSRQISNTRERPSLDRHDSRSGHPHLQHPLPPPPHLQHPLPPPPRGSLAGARSQSHPAITKATGSTSPSSVPSTAVPPKPLISTSQTTITGPLSNHATPTATTPRSATSLASPDTSPSKCSPKTETHTGGVKGDHILKSSDSNSSPDSLSSTGSISTAGSVSEILMATASLDMVTECPTLTSPSSLSQSAPTVLSSPKLSGVNSESAEPEASKDTPVSSVAKTSEEGIIHKSENTTTSPPPPPPPESPVASSDLVPPPPPPSSPPPPISTPESNTAGGGAVTGTHPVSTTPSANSSPVIKSSPTLSGPATTTTGSAGAKHSPLSGSSVSSLSSSTNTAKSKSYGRTPIPLPHKPIPLPPRPNAPPSAASSLKKKHK